jgi:Domain of Unknown Function (DUF1080)
MKLLLVIATAVLPALGQPGFQSIFDGKTFNGWSNPDMSYWSIENGAITGKSTPQHPARKNYYLIWQGGDVADFELKIKFRITGHESGNAGIQFRSSFNEDFTHATGYQADIDRTARFLGALYDEGIGRRELFAPRGQKAVADASGKVARTGFADPSELLRHINRDGWNEYHIVARGPDLRAAINGHPMFEAVDNDPKLFLPSGKLAIQLHVGSDFQIQYKDILLKTYSGRSK